MDAVVAVGGQFKMRPGLDAVPTVEVTMVHLSSITKTTFGSCPVQLFRSDTIEALMEFIRLAERDFGEAAFVTGVGTPFDRPISPAANSSAESPSGLPKGLGGT